MTTDKITKNMEVIGADGVHVGTIDAVANGRIRLAKRDSGEGQHKGHAHFIDLGLVADVEASGLWPGKVVTELSPAGDFWEAEPEHQDHLERYPNGYTCHFVRPQWKLRQQFLSSCSNSCQASIIPVHQISFVPPKMFDD